jgi:type I restriction enzyme S subunit
MNVQENRVQLGDIVEFIMGQAPPSSDSNRDGIGEPFVQVRNFGNLIPRIEEWTTKPLKMAAEGDVLICVVGSIGKVNLGVRAAITRSVAALRPKSVLDQKYLYYLMLHLSGTLIDLATGTAQVVLTKQHLSSLDVPLPPLEEQRRIVSYLDNQLSRLEKALSNVQSNESRFKTFSEVLIRNLFEDDFDSLSLGDVCKIIDCEHKTAPKTVTEIAGFSIGTSAIRHGVIDYAKAKPVAPETLRTWTARAKPVSGDVIFTREAPIGESALVPETPDICLGQRTVLIQKNLSVFEPEYLHLWLQSPQVRDWIGKHSTGTTVLHLNVADVKKLPLPKIPSISEQQSLVQKLRVQQTLARAAVREVPRIANQLNQLKRAILFEAFSESSRT